MLEAPPVLSNVAPVIVSSLIVFPPFRKIKKRHPSVEQLRDASLAWVHEIEGEVDEKARTKRRSSFCGVQLLGTGRFSGVLGGR